MLNVKLINVPEKIALSPELIEDMRKRLKDNTLLLVSYEYDAEELKMLGITREVL